MARKKPGAPGEGHNENYVVVDGRLKEDPIFQIAKADRDPTPMLRFSLHATQQFTGGGANFPIAVYGPEAEWLNTLALAGEFRQGSYCCVRGTLHQRRFMSGPQVVQQLFVRAAHVSVGNCPPDFYTRASKATTRTESDPAVGF